VDTPYIIDIDVIIYFVPYSNIRKKLKKVEIYLNINYYKSELKNLGNKGSTFVMPKKALDPHYGPEKYLKNK
jgi:hypothetical protein